MIGLKARHKVKQSRTVAVLSFPSSSAPSKRIQHTISLVHVSRFLMPFKDCFSHSFLRVIYQLNYFVVAYGHTPTHTPSKIAATVPLRVN